MPYNFTMYINYKYVEDLANAAYAKIKLARSGLDYNYTAPEAMPKIESEQVKCFMRALISEINLQSHNK